MPVQIALDENRASKWSCAPLTVRGLCARLAMRLEAAGIAPASVTDVVLTHLHMDHVGGLLTDGLKARLRPDLRVHLAAAEAEFWESPDFSRTHMPPGVPDALR
jgi:glyoxylase-like metal-dependent hydrolase (beta-lactamase superfamily II)